MHRRLAGRGETILNLPARAVAPFRRDGIVEGLGPLSAVA